MEGLALPAGEIIKLLAEVLYEGPGTVILLGEGLELVLLYGAKDGNYNVLERGKFHGCDLDWASNVLY